MRLMNEKFSIFKKVIWIIPLIILFSFSCLHANQWFGMYKGLNDDVFALKQYNGSIVAGGEFTNSFGSAVLDHIAVWNGVKWLPLASGFNNDVLALEVYNGDLVAGGKFNSSGGTPLNRIARWNGTQWVALGSGILGEVYALTVFQGNLIAAGNFLTVGGQAMGSIAKWNGTAWSALGVGLDNNVYALAVHNGLLYAGGSFPGKIAVWNGSSWNTVAGGLNSSVRALASYNNSLYVGGDFNEHIYRLNGSSWAKVGGGLDDDVLALTVYNGKLIAGGRFREADPSDHNGIGVNRIAQWNGAAWSAMSTGMQDDVYALALWDTRMVAGGKFKKAGGLHARRIAYTEKSGIIEGIVKYPNGNIVTRGIVKALRLDDINKKVIVSDTGRINSNGTYRLLKVPQTAHRLIIFPDDELDNFVPTYYPSTIYWQLSPVVIPDSLTPNINIVVYPKTAGIRPGKIKGKVRLNFDPPVIGFDGGEEDTLDYKADAIVYAKVGNNFISYGISGSDERYQISNLNEGAYQVIVSRLGYTSDLKNVTLNFAQGFVLDSVNFVLDPQEVIVSVTSNSTIPEDFKLYQNYPNPFNPVTNIKYDIVRNANVRLTVHDALGRKVSELVNGNVNAGSYTVNWNAANLTSGIYFYTIEVTETSLSPQGQNSSYIETRKMLLIK
jgi:hypothetical protein